jgi:hypothetical protein
MVDVVIGSTIYHYFNMPLTRPALLHLERWHRPLRGRKL